MLLKRFRFPLSLLLIAAASQSVEAQSLVWGSIEGRARGPAGDAIGPVSVVLTSAENGIERSFTSDRSGRFSISLVAPGLYTLRVESLGFRPVVLTDLAVPAGERLPVEVLLSPASGVVTDVDSVAAGVTFSGRQSRSGERIGPDAGRGLAFRTGALNEVAALSTSMDRYLGVEGLPGSMTPILVDGVLVSLAPHPSIRSEATASPLLNLATFSSLDILATPADVEWWGGGGALALTSRSGSERPGSSRIEGAFSADALQFSDEITDAAPGASFWGTAARHATLVPDTAYLSLVADAALLSTPTPARLTPAAAASIPGIDEGLRQQLGAPGIEDTRRVAAQARLDWWLDSSRRLALRAGLGFRETDADAYGPAALGFGTDPLQSSFDLSFATDYSSRRSDRTTLELRFGVNTSQRDFRSGDVAQALVVGSGARLGSAAAMGGESSRTGANLAATLRTRFDGGGELKGGVQLRGDRHSMTHSPYGGARFLFPDLAAVPGDSAAAIASDAPAASFQTADFGLFAQYTWPLAEDIRLSFAGRADFEVIDPSVTRNAAFEDASGLVNSDAPTSFTDFGVTGSLLWDLSGGRGTSVLTASASLQSGDVDPALIHELSVNDGSSRIQRFIGDGAGWPTQGLPAAGPGLEPITVFGSEMQPPQHSRLRAGLRNRIGESTVLFVGGSYRRSEFLPRRRNLNLPIAPTGSDANGRALYGDLRKLGGLVVTDGRADRRFSAFDAIWAIDPDGYSNYWGATIGIEHSSGPVEVSATYTRSSTEDNWVGARAGSIDAELAPALSATGTAWEEGTSDFDVPDRFVATAVLEASAAVSVGATYRYASGLPFTPGFRPGVDVNADGSGFNDPAFVSSVGELGSAWDCLDEMVGGFATRNGCRGDGRHALDLRLELALPVGGARIFVDALDVLESREGLRDTALLLVDPDAPLGAGGTSVPFVVNPNFGDLVLPGTPGRILRVGLRIGGL